MPHAVEVEGEDGSRVTVHCQRVPGAVLFRILIGRVAMVVDADAVVTLSGITYHGNDGYLVSG